MMCELSFNTALLFDVIIDNWCQVNQPKEDETKGVAGASHPYIMLKRRAKSFM